MLDLTKKALPNVVTMNGVPFSIHTDFRKWIKFEIEVSKLKKASDTIDVPYLFVNDKPRFIDLNQLFEFSRPHNDLPSSNGRKSHARAYDFEKDGDMIYASFMQAYGIDLFSIENLHYHKFLALLHNLPEGTSMRDVMGYRTYVKDSRKNVDVYEELQRAWALESEDDFTDEELEDFSNKFGE